MVEPLEIRYSTGYECASMFSTGVRVGESKLILLKPGYLWSYLFYAYFSLLRHCVRKGMQTTPSDTGVAGLSWATSPLVNSVLATE